MVLSPSGLKKKNIIIIIIIFESATGNSDKERAGKSGARSVSGSTLLIFPFVSGSNIAPCDTATGLPLVKILIFCSLWILNLFLTFENIALQYYFILMTECFEAPLNFVLKVSAFLTS